MQDVVKADRKERDSTLGNPGLRRMFRENNRPESCGEPLFRPGPTWREAPGGKCGSVDWQGGSGCMFCTLATSGTAAWRATPAGGEGVPYCRAPRGIRSAYHTGEEGARNQPLLGSNVSACRSTKCSGELSTSLRPGQTIWTKSPGRARWQSDKRIDVKGGGIVGQWGVEGQGKCPAKCSA